MTRVFYWRWMTEARQAPTSHSYIGGDYKCLIERDLASRSARRSARAWSDLRRARWRTTPAAPAQSLERVEVTGSLITHRRRNIVAGHYDQPRRAQKAGVTNAEQAVKFITQDQSDTVTTGSVSGPRVRPLSWTCARWGQPHVGAAERQARRPQPICGRCSRPEHAADRRGRRIETLSDGASATYGTDAIAGVINFITRREYTGLRWLPKFRSRRNRAARSTPPTARRLGRPGQAGLERLRRHATTANRTR